MNYLSSFSTTISEIINDDRFYSMLDNKVKVSDLQYVNVKSKQGKAMDTLYLAKQCMISLDRAKNTVYSKTQCGIRMVMNQHMPWWYPTNNIMMRYTRFPIQYLLTL